MCWTPKLLGFYEIVRSRTYSQLIEFEASLKRTHDCVPACHNHLSRLKDT